MSVATIAKSISLVPSDKSILVKADLFAYKAPLLESMPTPGMGERNEYLILALSPESASEAFTLTNGVTESKMSAKTNKIENQ